MIGVEVAVCKVIPYACELAPRGRRAAESVNLNKAPSRASY
jgi:hypothetical protein